MRFITVLFIVSLFSIYSCEEPDTVFPDSITLQCQEDVDLVSDLLRNGIYTEEDPAAAFRGDVIITSQIGNCESPITDLSFFNEHKFWLGSITIESDAFTDLSFLKNVEQIRGGFNISNCNNLQTLSLPKLGFIGQNFIVDSNEELASIEIGTALPEVYEKIGIDAARITNNPKLASWVKGSEKLDFIVSAEIQNNPELKNLEIFHDFSMPSSTFMLDMYGTVINIDSMNLAIDSLSMPNTTVINALAPNNDYSFLSKAKVRSRFNEDGVDVGRIIECTIQGSLTLEELCPIKDIAESISLNAVNTSGGSSEVFTPQDIIDACE